jgi:hypothetical protein
LVPEGKDAVLHASFKSLARHQKWRVFVFEPVGQSLLHHPKRQI